MGEIKFCIWNNFTGFKFLSLLVLNEVSQYARMPRICVLGSRIRKWKQFITNSCFVLCFITIIFAIIIFMSLQAGEGQAEIRGGGKAWAVSVCGSSFCPGCSAGGEQQYKNRWTDTQPFHKCCLLHSTPSQRCLQWVHRSHFGKEGLNKLRNRNSRTIFDEYSCISRYRDWVAAAERLSLA